MEYGKTILPVGVCVEAIVSVHYFRLSEFPGDGAAESHAFPELIYVEKDVHPLLLDGMPCMLRPGQLMIYAPYAVHGPAQEASRATIAIVSFEAESALLAGLYNRPFTVTPHQKTLLNQIITAGKELFQRRNPDPQLHGWVPREDATVCQLQKLKNLLELLLIDLSASESSRTPTAMADNSENYRQDQFEQMLRYMLENLHRELTLEQLSQACGLSPTQLNRICRASCGKAPMAQFAQLRIEEAKRLIRESSMNMTQIAEAMGFGSVHYFSRVFRKKTGISPSDYARSVLKT